MWHRSFVCLFAIFSPCFPICQILCIVACITSNSSAVQRNIWTASCGTRNVAGCYIILFGHVKNSWHVVVVPQFCIEFPSPKGSAVHDQVKGWQFFFQQAWEWKKHFCLYFMLLQHITGLNLPLLSKSKYQVKNATYGLTPHPVKLNNLP